MKNATRITLLATLLASTTAFANDAGCEDAGDAADLASLRAQRQAFNQAIADKDDQGIRNVLHERALLVTGTDSDLFNGRDAQVAIWRDDFARDDRAIYVRTPGCLRASGVAPVALEVGAWRGESVTDPGVFAAGSYAAKWRKVEGRWLLEGELFATESCGGSFCPENAGPNE